MRLIKGKTIINALMFIGVVFTVLIAALATHGYNGYTPSPQAWFLTLIVPCFLLILVTAYYNEKTPYQPSGSKGMNDDN